MSDFTAIGTMHNPLSRIDFGPGSSRALGSNLGDLAEGDVFLVTDRGVEEAGLCEGAIGSIEEAGRRVRVFADVRPNPTEAQVAAALDAYRASGCSVIVGMGGGSAMDVAKATALMATHDGRLADYDMAKNGAERIRPCIPPIVAVPTTAGTGSEVSAAAVITDEDAHAKLIVYSPHLLPRYAVIDPELALTMPPAVTAQTGIDALSHAIESYLVEVFHPWSDGLAKEAIELIGAYLPRAFANGQDLEARANMHMAAAIAGRAMANKGLGAAHALSHKLAAVVDAPHGALNAILLPHVMRFNAEAATHKVARVAELLGIDTRGMTDATSAQAAADRVGALCRELQLPGALSEIDCPADALDSVAHNAARDIFAFSNPRRCGRRDLRALLDAAF